MFDTVLGFQDSIVWGNRMIQKKKKMLWRVEVGGQ